MSRPLRIKFEGAWYHVMNRGINRALLFFNDLHRNEFLNLIQRTRKIYGIEIHAYCLMSNHYHLIIHTPRGNISDAMKFLNSNYARYVNLSMKRDGPLFKGRFKAILISADDYLIRLSHYIHSNPLEAKIVKTLTKYEWSSYLYYIGKKKSPSWLSTLEIIGRFGEKNFFTKYRNFVENTSDKELNDFFNNNYFKPVLGGDNFREIIDDYVKTHSLSPEVVGADRIILPPNFDTIINKVILYFNVKPEQIYQQSKDIKNLPRKIAIYICREFGGYSLNEIGKVFGNLTYKGIASAIRRIQLDTSQKKLAEMLIKQLEDESKNINIKTYKPEG